MHIRNVPSLKMYTRILCGGRRTPLFEILIFCTCTLFESCIVGRSPQSIYCEQQQKPQKNLLSFFFAEENYNTLSASINNQNYIIMTMSIGKNAEKCMRGGAHYKRTI